MTRHHTKATDVNGRIMTYCGKFGYREVGSCITIEGQMHGLTSILKPSADSCPACVKALPAKFKPPSIYTELRDRLKREPSNRELIKAAKIAEDQMDQAIARRRRNKRLLEQAAHHAMMKEKYK